MGYVKTFGPGLIAAVVLAACGCGPGGTTPMVWRLRKQSVLWDFKTPESMAVDPATGDIYVSNINPTSRGTVNVEDGRGFISRLGANGKVLDRRWARSTEANPIHSPKGMVVWDGWLCFTDMTVVKRCRLKPPGPAQVVPVAGAKDLNDMATDGKWLYASSTGQNRIYRIDPAGKIPPVILKGPAGVNGIAFHEGALYCVSVSKGKADLFEIDQTGKSDPMPFGLAKYFVGIDSIEVLSDGTFLVTDCIGHKICTVAPDRRTVRTVVEGLEYPADMGFNRKRGLVYVPEFYRGRAVIYELYKSRRALRNRTGWY